jgi:hypothetical protein
VFGLQALRIHSAVGTATFDDVPRLRGAAAEATPGFGAQGTVPLFGWPLPGTRAGSQTSNQEHVITQTATAQPTTQTGLFACNRQRSRRREVAAVRPELSAGTRLAW